MKLTWLQFLDNTWSHGSSTDHSFGEYLAVAMLREPWFTEAFVPMGSNLRVAGRGNLDVT